MLPNDKLNRLNFLAKESKTRNLSESEKDEQQVLRKEYIEAFKESFKKQLDRIEFTD